MLAPKIVTLYRCLQLDDYDLCHACFSNGLQCHLAFISQEHPAAEPVFIAPRPPAPAPAPAPAPEPQVSDGELGAHLVALVRSISSSCGHDIAPILMAIKPEDISGQFENRQHGHGCHPHPFAAMMHLRNLLAHRQTAFPFPTQQPPQQQQQQQQQRSSFQGRGFKCGGGPCPQPPVANCHSRVTCDGCGVSGFSGTRFKCTTCPDYDLCDTCYTGNVHVDTQHAFVSIDHPCANPCLRGIRIAPTPAPVPAPAPLQPSPQDLLVAAGCPRAWASAVLAAFGDNHASVAQALSSFPFDASAAGVESLQSMGFDEGAARVALLHAAGKAEALAVCAVHFCNTCACCVRTSFL